MNFPRQVIAFSSIIVPEDIARIFNFFEPNNKPIFEILLSKGVN